jgi:hypothetical protein
VGNRLTVAVVIATLAFWAYTQTLLPGVDLGDTGGFQSAVLWPEVSARQAYPLYYALAKPFVAAAGAANPARALNLVSAVWAAVAVALLVVVCASVTRSIAAGAVAGILLAFSHTFWTQAVIAEVYTLHLALVALCLLALHAYAARPTYARLLLVFTAYAASFGNHLGMILLLAPVAIFLLHVTPARGTLIRPRTVAAAIAIAAAGALQYAPNFLSVWASLDAPDAWSERLAAFWFDTTKQDWRESMVLGVHASELGDRLAMWAFDARQQFGVTGLALAAMGALDLWGTARPWAWLMLTAYALSTLFAVTYNVGDAHVFFLPGHLMTAFCAGVGVAELITCDGATVSMVRGCVRWFDSARVHRRTPAPSDASSHHRTLAPSHIAVLLVFAYAGWRGWTTWPVADRQVDRRGEQLIAQLTAGLDDRGALLVSHMDWQLENVLLYTARYLRGDLAWVRLGDVMTHWPFLVEDAHRLGRDVVLTADAAAEVLAAYGPSLPMIEDASAASRPLIEVVARVPRGLPYVLGILTPPPGYALDSADLEKAIATLTGGHAPARAPAAYEVVAGIAGDAPRIYRSSARPFTIDFRLLDEPLRLRLDGWLPFDTFRRAGFGHLLRGRERLLTVERGVSLVWLGRDGRPSPPQYAAGLFAPQPRYRIPAATLRLASDRPIGALTVPFRPNPGWREP